MGNLNELMKSKENEKAISTTMPKSEVKEIDALCKARGIRRNEFMRAAIRDAFAELEKEG